MRVLNRSLIVLFATVSSLALAGCLGTNTPTSFPAAIYESASGTGYVATRSGGFEDLASPVLNSAPNNSSTLGTGGPADFTAFTNGNTGVNGFLMLLPADSTDGNTPTTATLSNGLFGTTTASLGVFPVGTQITGTQAGAQVTMVPIETFTVAAAPVATGNFVVVDKFGHSQGLQDTEYGIWLESNSNVVANFTTPTSAGTFAVGIPTSIMPTTGTANYTGGAAGTVVTPNVNGEFAGTAKLTANFANNGGTITGTISGSSASTTVPIPFSAANNGVGAGTINPITLTGGTIAGNAFSGTATAIAGNPVASTVDITPGNANGAFGGTFNGVSAAEISGTFHLSSGSGVGATNVIGAFGAKQ